MTNTSYYHKTYAINDLPTVLVAGGASFIGRYLCRLLINQNCEVYVIDNLIHGTNIAFEKLIKHDHFHFIKADLNKKIPDKLPKLDYIFHLAGIDNYFEEQENLQLMLVNSAGTKNLLEIAKKNQSKFLLASHPYVYNGQISDKEIATYFGKKQDGQSFYSLAEAKRFSENITVEYFKSYHVNCRITRILDVYGPGMALFSKQPIAYLLNYFTSNTINIPGNGQRIIYPTYIEDAAYGMLKAMFNQESNGKIYTIASAEPISLLDFSHKINDLCANTLKVSFVAEILPEFSINKQEITDSQNELNWQPKIALNEGLAKTISWIKKQKLAVKKEIMINKAEKKEPAVTVDIDKKKLNINQKLRFRVLRKIFGKFYLIKNISFKKAGLIFALFLFLLMLIFALPLGLLMFYFHKGATDLNKNNYQQSLVYFNKAKYITTEFRWLNLLSFIQHESVKLTPILDEIDHFLTAEAQIKNVSDNYYQLMQTVFLGERGDQQELINQMKININQAYQEISLAESEKQSVDLNWNSKVFKINIPEKYNLLHNNLNNWRQKINYCRDGLAIFKDLISMNEKSKYLILFQDNTEMRPTGGFIKSVGILSLEKGKVLNLEIKDVYSLDSQLKGRIEPPQILSQYLNEKNWYLRDSNWDPSFPYAASQAQWFIARELGIETNATIAINLSFIKQLLEKFGPIQLADYNEIVSAADFYEKLIAFSEINFDQNNEDKDFLNQILDLLFKRIKNLKQEEMLKLMALIYEGFEEKKLLADFQKSSLNNFFVEKNWNGAIRNQQATTSKILTDYLFLVEANLGINKVNYYLTRSLHHEVFLFDDGRSLETMNIFYENNSLNSGWPGGDYKSYLRVYLPLSSRIISIKQGTNEDDLIEINNDKIKIASEHGKKIVGFLVEIPVKEKKYFKIIYENSQQLQSSDQGITYVFYWQKQPGFVNDNLILTLNYPKNWQPYKIAPQARINNYAVSFNANQGKDDVFMVEFLK